MRAPVSRLTVFAFLWACQALVHHEFYARWLAAGDPAGWVVLGFGVALLVRPSSLPLLVGLLLSSIAYNVRKWPFVVNHILLESLVNATLLAALAGAWLADRRAAAGADFGFRERAYERVAPVLRAVVVAMYGFAFLAKLNRGFLDPDVSCVAAMYGDVLRRVPFAPDAWWARELAIWGTLAIEGALPLLFAFRRTRAVGVLVGMPFHFMLGTIGHRTFSALAYALYGLFVMEELVPLLAAWRAEAERRLGAAALAKGLRALRVGAVAGALLLVAASLGGYYRAGIGPLLVFRTAWVAWGLWSLALMAAYFPAALRLLRAHGRAPAPSVPAFRWLYASLALVVLNGSSQYLGLKTENAFTMYSNLRTEAGYNNHLFLPALRLAGWQDDVVEVLESDLPALAPYAGAEERLTWFELRRITSQAPGHFAVRYRRNGGEERWFHGGNGDPGADPELAVPHSLVAAKLLSFRPVSPREHPLCSH